MKISKAIYLSVGSIVLHFVSYLFSLRTHTTTIDKQNWKA
jgi:hypothetical protein